MPIYDYRCDHCGHAFSAVQSFADAALGACPSCGRPPRRLLTPPAIVFKGSGWYKTDSRTPPKDDHRGPSPAETTPQGGEAKPAAKGDGAKAPGTAAAETPKT